LAINLICKFIFLGSLCFQTRTGLPALQGFLLAKSPTFPGSGYRVIRYPYWAIGFFEFASLQFLPTSC